MTLSKRPTTSAVALNTKPSLATRTRSPSSAPDGGDSTTGTANHPTGVNACGPRSATTSRAVTISPTPIRWRATAPSLTPIAGSTAAGGTRAIGSSRTSSRSGRPTSICSVATSTGAVTPHDWRVTSTATSRCCTDDATTVATTSTNDHWIQGWRTSMRLARTVDERR